MSQQTLGWKPLQIIHHYFPRDEKKMEAFIDANPGDGFVVNVKEPWNDPNDHAGYDTYLRQPEEWKTLDAFIRLCSRKGKRIWIYDEPGFPSGAAGRRVVETNPSYAVSCLAVALRTKCKKFAHKTQKGEESDSSGILAFFAYYYEMLRSRLV